MRIWYQSGAPLGKMGAYADALKSHVAAIVSPGTEVDFHGLPAEFYAGRPPAEVLKFAYARQLILSRIIENCIRAEREGYDAVALASYNDPFVREARSVVNIPVVSSAESSLLTACTLARRFALVTLTPENVFRLTDLVERHTMERRVSGIYALEPQTTERELSLAFADPSALMPVFSAAVEKAVKAGAELVIAAEGVLNEVLVAHRVTRLHEVPILDCIGNVLLHAEMMVGMTSKTGLSIGRRWEHARPADDLLSSLRRAAGLEE